MGQLYDYPAGALTEIRRTMSQDLDFYLDGPSKVSLLSNKNPHRPGGDFLCLVRCFEFLEEAGIVFGEHTEVGDAVFQVGDALDTHAEGVARVFLGVDTTEFEHVGIDHTTTEDLHPSGVLAEATTLATTDEAGDVHLC